MRRLDTLLETLRAILSSREIGWVVRIQPVSRMLTLGATISGSWSSAERYADGRLRAGPWSTETDPERVE